MCIIQLSKLQTLYEYHNFCCSYVLLSNLEFPHCLISLDFFNLWLFHCIFFHALLAWKNTYNSVLEYAHYGFVWHFLIIRLRLCLRGENNSEIMLFLYWGALYRVHCQLVLLLVMLILITIKVMTDTFLHYKVTIISLYFFILLLKYYKQ